MNYITNTQEMSIVFIGFDGYYDLWDDCFSLFNAFWSDCPYEVLFVNNELDKTYSNVKTLHAGKDAEWSKKVQLALQSSSSEYICLLLEDFFVGKQINTSEVVEALCLIKNDNILYYKLANMSRAVKNHDPIYKNIKYLHIIPESDEYGISLQPAIWKRDFLEKKLGTENYNAWKFEFDRVEESDQDNDQAKKGCIFDERNILKLKHGVVQSKYIPVTVRYFKKINIDLTINREILTYRQYFSIQAQSFFKYMLPKRIRNPIKKVLEKMGMKFVSTVRK